MTFRHVLVGATFAASVSAAGCTAVLGIHPDAEVKAPVVNCTGSIGVRIATDFTSFARDVGTPYFYGMYDYLRSINDNGGIRGCMIDIDAQDNKYDAAAMTDVVGKWRAGKNWKAVNAVFIFGTPPITAVSAELTKEQKVVVAGTYAGSLAAPVATNQTVTYDKVNTSFSVQPITETKSSNGWPYVFFPATDHGTAARVAVAAAWAIQQGKVAFARDMSGMCPDCEEPAAAGLAQIKNQPGMSAGRDLDIAQIPSLEPQYVQMVEGAIQKYFMAELEHFKTTNATKWDYEPVTWVWCGNASVSCALLGKTLKTVQANIAADAAIQTILKRDGKAWTLRVMANNWGIGEETTMFCGQACAADPGAGADGAKFYGLFPVPRYGDLQNSPGMAQLISVREKYAAADQRQAPPAPIPARGQTDQGVRYVQGYVAALMWEAGVKAAIDAGHGNPTGEDLKNALETFKKVDLQGLTSSPISFTSKDHRPQSDEAVYYIKADGTLGYASKYSVALQPEWLGY